MASTREIRRRIRSISSTAQITKAMQMVAASKMRKAQQAAIDVRPFVRLLYRIQRQATTRAIEFKHPLLEVRAGAEARGHSGRGRTRACAARSTATCSASPDATIRNRPSSSRPDARPRSSSPARGGSWSPSSPTATRRVSPKSRAIAALARDLFLKGEVDEVEIVATRFVNTLTQQPVDPRAAPDRRHPRRADPGPGRRGRGAGRRHAPSSCSSRAPRSSSAICCARYLNIFDLHSCC